MKFISNGRFFAWLLMALALGGIRVEAQTTNGFGLLAFTSTNSVILGGLVTNYVSVTNLTGIVLAEVSVTNEFSEDVAFPIPPIDYTNTDELDTNVTYATNDSVMVVTYFNVPVGAVMQLAVPWEPLTGGTVTNEVAVGADPVTNTVSTNFLTSVYSSQAALSVNLAYVAQGFIPITNYWVITNDWVTYQVAVTNLGPGSVSGVVLTNTLPPGAVLVKATPAPSSSVSNSLAFSPGTLAQGSGLVYQVTIEETNAGAYSLMASATAPDLSPTATSTNEVSTALFVTNYLPATFTAGTNSGQIVNQQNGLIEQTIMVTNTGGAAIPAVRVVIKGLTNQLYNAIGTNNGLPFVVCPASLAPGGQVGMVLQFNPRLPFHFTNGQLSVYALPSSVLYYTPPPFTNTVSGYYKEQMLKNGSFLLEFTNLAPSYTVIYSDNIQFSNAMIATPAVSSEANRIQWIDYGPPETVSSPTNSGARYYLVIPNP